MKKILLIFLLTACQTSTTQNLGEQFTPANVITIDDALGEHPKESIDKKNVHIEGTVEKSCMSEGCWFTIKDKSGKEILFDVKDKKFRVPINSPGKEVILLADISVDSSLEQKIKLDVRGMRFK